MIQMGMSNEKSFDLFGILGQKRYIWNRVICSEHLWFCKLYSTVYENKIILILEHSHIFCPDFIISPDRDITSIIISQRREIELYLWKNNSFSLSCGTGSRNSSRIIPRTLGFIVASIVVLWTFSSRVMSWLFVVFCLRFWILGFWFVSRSLIRRRRRT